MVGIEHRAPDRAEERWAVEGQTRAVAQEAADIAAAAVVKADSQARDLVEGILAVGFVVYFVGAARMGVAGTIESGLGGKICRADGSLGG